MYLLQCILIYGSASTAEYCGVNKGVVVGSCIISSLAFVDDMLDASEDTSSAEMAHLQALAFSLKNGRMV